jgi:uncharacterized protein (TIGR01777 family)
VRVLVTGGTGFIGRAVVARLRSRGDQIVLISRSAPGALPWNEVTKEVARADGIVHLAGEPIATRRWTPERLAEIRDSRVATTERIARAVALARNKPRVVVSASAVGIYGTGPRDEPIAENAPAADDALATLCADWEAATRSIRDAGVRVVLARFGIVLGADGGALPQMLTPFKLFVGGPIGDGRQVMSWIHLEDAARATAFVIDRDDLSGPVNFVAPAPVTMNEFAGTLGDVLGRPSSLRVPAALLRVALGRERAEMILTGQRVTPEKLLRAGFSFDFPELRRALAAAVARQPVRETNPLP